MSYVLFGELSATTSKMFVERLATITPLRRTSSGRRGVGDGAVGGGRRIEIEQVLDARELFLDGGRDGLGERLGRGAGIARGDGDRGRRDLRVLGDGQDGRGDEPCDDQDDRQYGREDGTFDEKPGHGSLPLFAELSLLLRFGGLRAAARFGAVITFCGGARAFCASAACGTR